MRETIYILVSHFVWLVLSTHCFEASAEAPYIGLIGDPPCPDCGVPHLATVHWAAEKPGIDKRAILLGTFGGLGLFGIMTLVCYALMRWTEGRDPIRYDLELESRPPQTVPVERQQDRPPQKLPRERPFTVRHLEAFDLVSAFPSHRISREECANHDICEICRYEFEEGNLVRVFPPCGHFYHHHCICHWMAFGALNCPQCRAVIV